MKLHGKTALVTGANRGIGRAIAAELESRGASVLRGCGASTPSTTPPAGRCELDLSSRESIEEGLAALDALSAEIDILVNNAGYFDGGLFDRITLDDIYELVQVNLAAPMHLTRCLLPNLLRRDEALIVNNASIVGAAPFPGAVAYAATKGGVVAFCDSLRRELADTDVRVLELITPGVDTDMMEKVQEQLAPHVDTDGWDHVEPEDWAGKVADAIESGKEKLHPSTAERLAELLPAPLMEIGAKEAFDR